MAYEAFMVIDLGLYTDKIREVINIFRTIDWGIYNPSNKVEYVFLDEKDDYDWQESYMTEEELYDVIDLKQASGEGIGLSMFYQGSPEGVEILARNTREIMVYICINRKTILADDNRPTYIVWYYNNIIKRLMENGYFMEYYEIKEYMG